MGDAMERNCYNCGVSNCQRVTSAGTCMNHLFPEEVPPREPVSFVGLIKEALPKDEKFSLDKLIDDHWSYVEDMLSVHGTEQEAIDIVGFHYKSAFRHGFKHAMEHYGIEEKNDE